MPQYRNVYAVLISTATVTTLLSGPLCASECRGRTCAAGTGVRTASAGRYHGGGPSYVSFSGPGAVLGTMAAMEAQAASDAAAVRQARILREATTDARRLAAADEALSKGDIRVASRIYVRVGLSKPPNASSLQAKRHLAELQAKADEKLKELEARLEDPGSGPTERRDDVATVFHAAARRNGRWAQTIADSLEDVLREARGAGDSLREARASSAAVAAEDYSRLEKWRRKSLVRPPGSGGEPSSADKERVLAVFKEYRQLAEDYGDVPSIGAEIQKRLAKLERHSEYAAILNEPLAASLWAQGQEHERADEQCCAYWAYKDAAELAPAPSAVRARERVEKMEKDPRVLAAAETCRELRWCHEAYRRAERLAESKPARARELFAEIVQRAPKDSKVYLTAVKRL